MEMTLDMLLSEAQQITNKIFDAQRNIEEIQAVLMNVAKSDVVLWLPMDGGTVAEIASLTDDQKTELKGYINAMLFENMAESRAYLEQVTGHSIPVQEPEVINLDEVDNELNHDIIDSEEEDVKKARLNDELIGQYVEAGAKAKDVASEYGIKTETVYKYMSNYRQFGCIKPTPEMLEDRARRTAESKQAKEDALKSAKDSDYAKLNKVGDQLIKAQVKKGMSIKSIAEGYEVDKKNLVAWMEEHKIPRRLL